MCFFTFIHSLMLLFLRCRIGFIFSLMFMRLKSLDILLVKNSVIIKLVSNNNYLCFMNENLNSTNQNYSPEEIDVEKKLRPLSFDDFAGQEQILENLQVFVKAANMRGEALDHALFHGPPGLGKTTLANI